MYACTCTPEPHNTHTKHTCTLTYVCMHTWKYIFMYACTHTGIHVCRNFGRACVFLHLYVHRYRSMSINSHPQTKQIARPFSKNSIWETQFLACAYARAVEILGPTALCVFWVDNHVSLKLRCEYSSVFYLDVDSVRGSMHSLSGPKLFALQQCTPRIAG